MIMKIDLCSVYNVVCVYLVWFYGISSIVGYFMPNPVLYIKYMIWKHIFVDNILK